ncbi:hypothetical protein Salat_1144200 [Sesamum alatum]|uniref:Uncharacterized protein n=1 Tax=Sesamum alatum TaxID=300844 RepID=A0AAE1YEJ8_9LAMI|nr:hypothetical protein Salat_1144200 [Sesamum alatum]
MGNPNLWGVLTAVASAAGWFLVSNNGPGDVYGNISSLQPPTVVHGKWFGKETLVTSDMELSPRPIDGTHGPMLMWPSALVFTPKIYFSSSPSQPVTRLAQQISTSSIPSPPMVLAPDSLLLVQSSSLLCSQWEFTDGVNSGTTTTPFVGEENEASSNFDGGYHFTAYNTKTP